MGSLQVGGTCPTDPEDTQAHRAGDARRFQNLYTSSISA